MNRFEKIVMESQPALYELYCLLKAEKELTLKQITEKKGDTKAAALKVLDRLRYYGFLRKEYFKTKNAREVKFIYVEEKR